MYILKEITVTCFIYMFSNMNVCFWLVVATLPLLGHLDKLIAFAWSSKIYLIENKIFLLMLGNGNNYLS